MDAVLRHADSVRRLKTGGSGANTGGVVYEPALTLGLPREETVGTAMNALAHCAEALYAGPCDNASLGAERIARRLPAVVSDGGALEARTGCSKARCTAAWRSRNEVSSWRMPWRRRSAGATESRTVR